MWESQNGAWLIIGKVGNVSLHVTVILGKEHKFTKAMMWWLCSSWRWSEPSVRSPEFWEGMFSGARRRRAVAAGTFWKLPVHWVALHKKPLAAKGANPRELGTAIQAVGGMGCARHLGRESLRVYVPWSWLTYETPCERSHCPCCPGLRFN